VILLPPSSVQPSSGVYGAWSWFTFYQYGSLNADETLSGFLCEKVALSFSQCFTHSLTRLPVASLLPTAWACCIIQYYVEQLIVHALFINCKQLALRSIQLGRCSRSFRWWWAPFCMCMSAAHKHPVIVHCSHLCIVSALAGSSS
jgi:hypothetical protein